MIKPFLPLALVLALSACSLAPRYERPVAPVDAAWPTGPAYDSSVPAGANPAVPAAEIGWREFFADPYLQSLIEASLANNRDLRIAALNIEQARALYQIQSAARLPTINATADGVRQRTPADLSRTGQASTSNQVSVGLGFSSFELDFFGRIANLREQALQEFLATEEARRSTHISLVSEVANAYLTLLADRQRLRLAQDTLASQRESFKLTQSRFEYGVANDLEVNQARTSVETARGDAARFTAQIAQDENALRLLVGGALPPEPAPAQAIGDARLLTALPAGLPSDLLQYRPDILQVEHRLRGANANIGAARARFFPSISLTAGIGLASPALSGLFQGSSRTWSFAPGVTLPIFDSGAIQANYDVSVIGRDIYVAQYEQVIQSAFREVADALAVRGTIDEQLDAQRSLTDAAQRTYTLSEARYRGGIDSYLTSLDSQRALYSAQQGFITTQLSALTSQVTLYKALGGGWSERRTTADAGNPAATSTPIR
jgi:multidrug efflux system outer membrane protein